MTSGHLWVQTKLGPGEPDESDDTGLEARALVILGPERYFTVTEAPPNIEYILVGR